MVVLVTAALLAGGWHRGSAKRFTLGHSAPVGFKQAGSFNGASLLAKTGFRWDFNPQSPGDPSVLPAACLQGGGRAVIPALSLLRGCREMKQLTKSQALALLPAPSVMSFGKALALPGCSRGGEQQQEDKSPGVRGADTAPANRRSVQAALWRAAGGRWRSSRSCC